MPIGKMVNIVNRTIAPLDGMFDGQPVVLIPGYKVEGEGKEQKIVGAGPNGAPATNVLPYFAAELIKRQNPVMGTEDPENPAAFECLLGVVEWGDDIDPIKQSDAEERIDRSLLGDEAQTAKSVETGAGRRLKNAKKMRRGRYVDPRLKNPVGLKADYAD
jgi:hypothetical protein